jgi:hypothetical protein
VQVLTFFAGAFLYEPTTSADHQWEVVDLDCCRCGDVGLGVDHGLTNAAADPEGAGEGRQGRGAYVDQHVDEGAGSGKAEAARVAMRPCGPSRET